MEPQPSTSTAKKKQKKTSTSHITDTEAPSETVEKALGDESNVVSRAHTALEPAELGVHTQPRSMGPRQPHQCQQRSPPIDDNEVSEPPTLHQKRYDSSVPGPPKTNFELAGTGARGAEGAGSTPANEAGFIEEEDTEEEEEGEEEDKGESDENLEEAEEEEVEETGEFDESASTSSIAEQTHKPPKASTTDSPVIERSSGAASVSVGAATEAAMTGSSSQVFYRPSLQQSRILGVESAHVPVAEGYSTPFSDVAHPALEFYYNYSQKRAPRTSNRGGHLPPNLPHDTRHAAALSAPIAGPSSSFRDTGDYYSEISRSYGGRWGQPSILPEQSERLERALRGTEHSGDSFTTTGAKVEKTSRRSRRHQARMRAASSQASGADERLEIREDSMGQIRGDESSPGSQFPAAPPARFQRAESWSPGYVDRFDRLVEATYTQAAAAASASQPQGPIYRPHNYPERRPISLPEHNEPGPGKNEDVSYEVEGGPSREIAAARAWQSARDYYAQQRHLPIYGPQAFPVGQYGPPTAFTHISPPLGHRSQPFSPASHPEFFEQLPRQGESTQASLQIQGNLWDMTKNWSIEETKSGRRLVKFERAQQGVVVYLRFEAIAPSEYREDMAVVSCIWRRETQEYFVTSVDCISLLQLIINQKFSVEEKNRIRRNLEVCKPITVSKSKPALEGFFRKIMSFAEPKPRNIEKDVKVFLWSNLEGALRKIVSKYSASWGPGRG